MLNAQTIYGGYRHEGVCRKVLFGEPDAPCSCQAPFPIKEDVRPSQTERAAALKALIVAADAADAAYSDVIRKLYGRKATRWNITAAQACNREVNAAFRAKLDADAAYHRAFGETK